MAESKTGFLDKLRSDPAVGALMDSVKDYGVAKAGSIASKAADKAERADSGDGGGGPIATAKKEGAKGAIKGFFQGLFKKGGGGKRPTHIYESLLVGVPLDVAWDAWQEYQDWPNFTKGPEKAELDKDGNAVSWTVKIFWSRRTFKGEIEEEIPNQRLKWKGSGAKGALSGAATFTALGDNMTLILVVLEYRSKGMMEWIGNRWRAQGRRVRLDLKHFARNTTMTGYESQFDSDAEEEEQEEPDRAGERDQGQPDPAEQPSTRSDRPSRTHSHPQADATRQRGPRAQERHSQPTG